MALAQQPHLFQAPLRVAQQPHPATHVIIIPWVAGWGCWATRRGA